MDQFDAYRSIAAPAQGLFKDNGSRFIAFAYPVETEDQVKELVQALRKEYHDARHHCFAYRLGYKGDVWRASDDGEPSGSAGRPILGQIDSLGLSDVLVVVDDIAIPLGTLRMKRQGSNGGHNGLADIDAVLGTNNYCRLRMGVGSDFTRGHQIDYVLGQFSSDERALLDPQIERAAEAVKNFATMGPERAMNICNTKPKDEAEK